MRRNTAQITSGTGPGSYQIRKGMGKGGRRRRVLGGLGRVVLGVEEGGGERERGWECFGRRRVVRGVLERREGGL